MHFQTLYNKVTPRESKIDLIVLFRRKSRAWSAISVVSSSLIGRKRILATSSATFPLQFKHEVKTIIRVDPAK